MHNYVTLFLVTNRVTPNNPNNESVYILNQSPPPYGRTSRVWDSLLVMKSGCAGGRGVAPRPGQYSKESFVIQPEKTGKIVSPKIPFYYKL